MKRPLFLFLLTTQVLMAQVSHPRFIYSINPSELTGVIVEYTLESKLNFLFEKFQTSDLSLSQFVLDSLQVIQNEKLAFCLNTKNAQNVNDCIRKFFRRYITDLYNGGKIDYIDYSYLRKSIEKTHADSSEYQKIKLKQKILSRYRPNPDHTFAVINLDDETNHKEKNKFILSRQRLLLYQQYSLNEIRAFAQTYLLGVEVLLDDNITIHIDNDYSQAEFLDNYQFDLAPTDRVRLAHKIIDFNLKKLLLNGQIKQSPDLLTLFFSAYELGYLSKEIMLEVLNSDEVNRFLGKDFKKLKRKAYSLSKVFALGFSTLSPYLLPVFIILDSVQSMKEAKNARSQQTFFIH